MQGPTERDRLIELFVKRKPRYLMADVVRLTRLTHDDLARAAADGEITPLEGTLSWADVAHLALRHWTPRMIDAALGQQRVGVIPLLNRVEHIEVWLPLYQIRFLHYLANREQGTIRAPLNASDIIERLLLDHASGVHDDDAEEAVPGFYDALRYPYFIQRDDDIGTTFCRYCGRISDIVGRELCEDCSARHQPERQLGRYVVPELEEP
jgi:hypothetical protein